MSLTSSELLQLRWNSYETNFHLAFSEIRENNKFHDVTIATPDGHVLAHRVLLSAFSPVLARILDVNPHPHPLLYIHGIQIKHIGTILDFMYKGEAHISQDSMDEFLAAAEELKVTGLSETRKDSQEQAKEPEIASQKEAKDTVDTVEDVSEHVPEQTVDACPISEVGEENSQESSKDNPTESKNDVAAPTYCPSKEQTFEEITIDDDDDEVINDSENVANESVKNTPDSKKELKRKSESEKRIENAIDSVIRESVAQTSPKVRKVSSNQNGGHGLVDSDGAPILNTNLEDGEVEMLDDFDNDISYEEVLGDGIDWDQKQILTKSDEDRARFRTIVDGMITKNSDDDGYKCLMCGREFPGQQSNAKKNAVSHVDHIHTDHLLHKCHICDVIVKTSDSLTRHIGKFHKNKDKEEVYDYIPVN